MGKFARFLFWLENGALESKAKPLTPALSPLGRGEGDKNQALVYLTIT